MKLAAPCGAGSIVAAGRAVAATSPGLSGSEARGRIVSLCGLVLGRLGPARRIGSSVPLGVGLGRIEGAVGLRRQPAGADRLHHRDMAHPAPARVFPQRYAHARGTPNNSYLIHGLKRLPIGPEQSVYDVAIEKGETDDRNPLTDSERDALTAAARRPDGRIHPLPEDVDADLIVGKLVVRST